MALSALDPVHLAQTINYLAPTSASLWQPMEDYNLEVGLLINFGAEKLGFKRLFNKKFLPFPTNK